MHIPLTHNKLLDGCEQSGSTCNSYIILHEPLFLAVIEGTLLS